MWWTCEPLYVLTNMAIKASIALFLLRLCVHKYHRAVVWAVTAITEVYSLFFFLLFVLQCRPTALFWLRYTADPPAGQCLDAVVVSNAFYGYSAIKQSLNPCEAGNKDLEGLCPMNAGSVKLRSSIPISADIMSKIPGKTF